MPAQMQSVSSSMISSIGYDSTTSELFVTFSNGATYKYLEVPQDTFSSIMISQSVGSFFIKNIKNTFRFEKQ